MFPFASTFLLKGVMGWGYQSYLIDVTRVIGTSIQRRKFCLFDTDLPWTLKIHYHLPGEGHNCVTARYANRKAAENESDAILELREQVKKAHQMWLKKAIESEAL